MSKAKPQYGLKELPPGAAVALPHVLAFAPARWEYRTERYETGPGHPNNPTANLDAMHACLNGLGADGWEVCGVVAGSSGVRVFFKRPAAPVTPRRPVPLPVLDRIESPLPRGGMTKAEVAEYLGLPPDPAPGRAAPPQS
jgi:hypothetical protein